MNNFEWIEETSQFTEDFIKNYNEESDERYCLEVDVQYPKNYMNFIWKNENWKSINTCS